MDWIDTLTTTRAVVAILLATPDGTVDSPNSEVDEDCIEAEIASLCVSIREANGLWASRKLSRSNPTPLSPELVSGICNNRHATEDT